MTYFVADWIQRRLDDGTATDADLQRLLDGEITDALYSDALARPASRHQAAPVDDAPDEVLGQLRNLARRR